MFSQLRACLVLVITIIANTMECCGQKQAIKKWVEVNYDLIWFEQLI
jgi:hypothetical protein